MTLSEALEDLSRRLDQDRERILVDYEARRRSR